MKCTFFSACLQFGLSLMLFGTAAKRPNIVLILADDMGYSDPGFAGGDIETPELDRLASGGSVFTHGLNHAKCEPSRSSLMSGIHFQRLTHDHVTRSFEGVETLPERLSAAGYHTMMVGKWHLPDGPTDHGFQRYFGLLSGAGNHFDPMGWLEMDERYYLGQSMALNGVPYQPGAPEKASFYSTTTYTDYALQFLEERPGEQPFFLFLSYTAPHWPLQAPESVIAKYAGRYDHGWAALRRERLLHMTEVGLLPEIWNPADIPLEVPAWNEWPDQADASRAMSVHAAMVDQMDQEIGRVLNRLEKEGVLENTLVLFLSDNGPAWEPQFDRSPNRPAGPPDSFRVLPKGFVHAVNTPFRGYKKSLLAGGNRTLLIAHWPGQVPAGRISHAPFSILDFTPTLLELAGAPCEDERLDGLSRVGLLTGGEVSSDAGHPLRLVYSEAAERGYIAGEWKLHRFGASEWSLYHLLEDGSESRDRAPDFPQLTRQLSEQYEAFESKLPLTHTQDPK